MLGCIADDFTGATDLAVLLRRQGMSVTITVGVPDNDKPIVADAVIIALKSRNIEPARAVELSLSALNFLRANGATSFYFKYCSTFDSTSKGNIGPVTDALMDALAVRRTVAVPAFPENGRRVFMGHLFVSQMILSESSLAQHPITPMTDSNIPRVLKRQRRGQVALIDTVIMRDGLEAIRGAYEASCDDCVVVCDTLDDNDIGLLADAFFDNDLNTGGSAFGAAIGARQARCLGSTAQTVAGIAEPRVICFSGSASEATRQQLAHALDNGFFGIEIDVGQLRNVGMEVERILGLIEDHAEEQIILHTPPYRSGEKNGSEIGASIDRLFGRLTSQLQITGYNAFVVAGGETSGAVVSALGEQSFAVGPEIAAGVPWIIGKQVMMALKSGNFGGPDFFADALALMPITGQRHG